MLRSVQRRVHDAILRHPKRVLAMAVAATAVAAILALQVEYRTSRSELQKTAPDRRDNTTRKRHHTDNGLRQDAPFTQWPLILLKTLQFKSYCHALLIV